MAVVRARSMTHDKPKQRHGYSTDQVTVCRLRSFNVCSTGRLLELAAPCWEAPCKRVVVRTACPRLQPGKRACIVGDEGTLRMCALCLNKGSARQ